MQRTPTPRLNRVYSKVPEAYASQSKRLQLSSIDLNDWFAEAADSAVSLDRRFTIDQRFDINPLDSTSQQTLSSKFKIDLKPRLNAGCDTTKARYVPLSPCVRPMTPSSSRPQSSRASLCLDGVSSGEVRWLENGKQFNLLQSRMQNQAERHKSVSCEPVQFHRLRKLLIPNCEFTSIAPPNIKPVKATFRPPLPFETEIREFQVAISSLRTVLKKKRQTSRPEFIDKENHQSRQSMEDHYMRLLSEMEAVSQKIDLVRMENVWLENNLASLRC